MTMDSRWDIDACPLLTRSAEREEEFPLTETTPASQSPESYSPARSVHSVGVSSASSPAEAVSPEYTGGASTTGDFHRDVLNKQMSHSSSFLCANTILSCPQMCLAGAVQSYTWSLTYTVTTAGGSTPEVGHQLPCMRNSTPVPPPASAHRMPVYTHREEHGYL